MEGSVGITRIVREMVVVLVSVPEVPVIVTVTVPVVAVLLAERVKALVLVVVAGLNEGVTPLGRPEADRLTLPLKPLSGFTVIVLVPVAPCVMVRLIGDAERVKFGGGLTVRDSVVELDRLPDEPVMVTVAVPVVAVLLAVSVNVLEPVVVLGLNDAVTPAGNPEAARLTLLLKPLRALMAILLVPLAPCTMVKEFGEAESVKFPWGFTVRERVVVLVKPADVPVTVTVNGPVAAVPVADIVKRLLAVAGFVPNAAVIPLGKPDAARVTLPLKPLRGLIEMVAEAEAPCRIVRLDGEAESRKPGCVVDAGQLLTRLAALTVPMPVAKSQPVVVP